MGKLQQSRLALAMKYVLIIGVLALLVSAAPIPLFLLVRIFGKIGIELYWCLLGLAVVTVIICALHTMRRRW